MSTKAPWSVKRGPLPDNTCAHCQRPLIPHEPITLHCSECVWWRCPECGWVNGPAGAIIPDERTRS